MGVSNRIFAPASLALLLAGCIPSGHVARPAPTPAQPSSTALVPVPTQDVPGGDARPTWTLQPVAVNAQQVASTSYVVRRGDTLRSIGELTGVGSETLATENGLAPPYTIFPGQTLRVPSGLYHRVGAGETGIGIAHAYGADWGEIVTLNALTEPYVLRIGQRLRLPSGARPQPPGEVDISQRAAAFLLDIDDIATGSQPALAENRAPAAPAAAPKKPVTTAIAAPANFTGKFRWPIDGRVIARFGPLAPGKVNDGINIAVAEGSPIRASADGVVAYAGDQIGVYGGLVLINHGGGWMSAYGHAGRLDVQRGQSVKAGDIIALSGATGQVQSPQLMFQLRKNRVPVDPLKQLPAR